MKNASTLNLSESGLDKPDHLTHGFFHCDIIHPNEQIEKQPIPGVNFNEALIIAEHDLRQFWKFYRDKFIKEVKNYGKR